jgi:hypothetical protein
LRKSRWDRDNEEEKKEEQVNEFFDTIRNME